MLMRVVCLNADVKQPIATRVCVFVCLCVCRVIDLGVMIPCDRILREAVQNKAGLCQVTLNHTSVFT